MFFFKRLGKYRKPEASEKQLQIKVHMFFQNLSSVSVATLLKNTLSRIFLSACLFSAKIIILASKISNIDK